MEDKIFGLDEAWPLMEKFEKDVFKQVFPNSKFLNKYSAGSMGGCFAYDGLFNSTPYEIGLQQSFIHYTSLQSLTAILNNGYFRFSEFRHFEDKDELHYAKKLCSDNEILKSSSQKIDDKKECCFALSACIISDETMKSSFMWEKYGNKGKGVIIQFKLNYNKSCHFLCGKIQYGYKDLKPIKQLIELAQKFYAENNKFKYDDFTEVILELLAYHKFEKFSEESEVRMFFREDKPSHEEHNHEAIYKDITSDNEARYFFRTFLTERKAVLEKEAFEILKDLEKTKSSMKEYFEHYPTIDIQKIILGNNVTDDQKFEIVQLLQNLKNKYNYNFEILYINKENEIFKYK